MTSLTAIRSRWTLVLFLLLLSRPLGAAGEVDALFPYRRGERLCLDLRASDLLDARTASTIESGLPGTCVYHIRLLDAGDHTVAEHLVELSLRLDLWENRYLLDELEQTSFHTLAAADSAWSHREGIDLCPLDRLDAEREYVIEARVAVTPLAAEDRERLSRYVTSNSGRRSEELSLDLGGLFGQLLKRSGGEDGGRGYRSPGFTLSGLEARP